MTPKCQLFVELLEALNPAPDDESLDHTLYDLCKLIKGEPDAVALVPHIFRFLEAHPNAQHGTPGALVHFLEGTRAYEAELIASVQRKPTSHTAWMVNRILNSQLTPTKRAALMDLMWSILANPQADETAKLDAKGFLEHQASRQP